MGRRAEALYASTRMRCSFSRLLDGALAHTGRVCAARAVTVRWRDETWAEQEETFTGLWATCVQHEIDHLNGKLFIDYLGLMKRQMITRKMEKVKREIARGGR
jgi:peptide deformylase